MTKLRLRIAISLDGYTSGPNQSLEDPLGAGGENLHQWALPLAVWRNPHGLKGGEENASGEVLKDALANVGATIMGRNMFGGYPGPWKSDSPWNGWWGEDPPFHHPVFVLTHHSREQLVLEGNNTFTFVTDGIESALELAKRAANGKDITLAGGATIAREYLNAGLVDEMLLHQVPILLGDGERLFEGVDDLDGLELESAVDAPGVTHLQFVRKQLL